MKEFNLVKCNVSDCIHFDNNYCTSGEITIGGCDASTCEQTCCDTFTKSNVAINAIVPSDDAASTVIQCDVIGCLHNENCNCMLDGIDVDSCDGAGHADISDQTCCTSFSCK